MAFIVILIGVISVSGMTKMKHEVEALYADRLVPAIDLGKMSNFCPI
jgi:hypothetical protein